MPLIFCFSILFSFLNSTIFSFNMLHLLLRPFVHRFIAGEDQDAALKYAKSLRAKKIIPILDVLGEHAEKKAQIVRSMGQYLQLLEGMKQKKVWGDISLKLTALGMDIEPLLCYRAVLRVLQKAHEQGVFVWLDMENSPYTSETIRMYRKLAAVQPNVGIAIQADMKRSRKDVLSLLPDKPRIRIVKGAYVEHESVTFQSHSQIRENFKSLIALCMEKENFVAVATHDPALIEYAMQLPHAKHQLEFQLLKGVRDDEKQLIVEKGFVVKEYCAFGTEWEPYIVRRIQEFLRNMKWALLEMVEKK
jgi:proline dehydrogenase